MNKRRVLPLLPGLQRTGVSRRLWYPIYLPDGAAANALTVSAAISSTNAMQEIRSLPAQQSKRQHYLQLWRFWCIAATN